MSKLAELQELVSVFPEGYQLLYNKLRNSKGMQQTEYYAQETERCLKEFSERLRERLHYYIKRDNNPAATVNTYAEDRGFDELFIEKNVVPSIQQRLLSIETLDDRINRLYRSKLIRMPTPVGLAIFDGVKKYGGEKISLEERNQLLFGQLTFVALSESEDRIVDKDEDLDVLDDFRVLNPYLERIATENIEPYPEAFRWCERGLVRATMGQRIDREIKENPRSISYQKMEDVYAKIYEPVGTFGRNMALNIHPFDEIMHVGGGKLGCKTMCGDEFEDSHKANRFDVPSWPLYFAYQTKNPKKALELTLEQANRYGNEARIALKMLPSDFPTLPFLRMLFPAVGYYVKREYKRCVREISYPAVEKQITTLYLS